MVNCTSIDCHHRLEIFETFKIEGKIQELKKLVKDKELDVFDGANLIIVVPTIDESGRFIPLEDKALFSVQKRDATRLAEFFSKETKSHVLEVILDSDKIADATHLVNKQIDYVLFLHEFLDFERDYVLDELKESGYGALQAIELY